MNVDYDPTEGAGGLSVSSYDSIDDDRSPVDVRGYPYRGEFFFCFLSVSLSSPCVWSTARVSINCIGFSPLSSSPSGIV